jgi:hypothetical protein
MPYLVDRPLDEAWSEVHGGATGVTSHDMSLRDRYTGAASSRSRWKVCTQSVKSGDRFHTKIVNFGVVRTGETCMSDAARRTLLHKQAMIESKHKAEARAKQTKAKAKENARRARERAEAERVRNEESRKPVLDGAARSACSVLAQQYADVVTKQDRSDFTRAFNYYARSSSERKIVEAGQDLTDNVGSWTGFMWNANGTRAPSPRRDSRVWKHRVGHRGAAPVDAFMDMLHR